MKNKIKLASLIFIFATPLFVLSSCNNDINSSVTSGENKLNISGTEVIEVGQEVPFQCSIKDVIWESSNSDVASISVSGVVKGIKPGHTTIKATSKADSSIFDTLEVDVVYPKATKVTLKVQGDDTITLDATKNVWNIPLGKTCIVDYEVPAGTREPDSVSFDVQYSGGETEIANAFKVEPMEDENGRTVGKVSTLGVVENVVVRFKGYYVGNQINDPSLQASLTFTVDDINAEHKEKLDKYISAFETKEQTSFVSGTYKVTRTEGEDTVLEDTLELKSYTTATYGKRTTKTKDNNQGKVLNYFNGIDESKNRYFSFSYDADENIQDFYTSEAKNDTNAKQATMPFILKNDLPVYGLAKVISSYFTSDFGNGLHNFANLYCYANAKFEFATDKITVSSSYQDDDSQNFTTTLTIGLTNDAINSFTLEVKTTENDKQVVYKEELSSLTFGTRSKDTAENANHLDLNQYYVTSFGLEEIAGQSDPEGNWNYSDKSRYGSQSIVQVDSKKKYILSANKTLVFRVNELQPSKANLLVDTISVKSSQTNIIPNPTMTGIGIFAISPYQSQDGKFATGTSELTFTSLGGGSLTIIVEFTEIKLTGIKVDSRISNILNNEIRVGDSTSSFTLNPIPDDVNWNFDIEITQGDEDGIALHAWEDSNWQGHSTGSYSIEALKVGEYKFKFVIAEQTDIKSDEYSIKVIEPLSNDYIKQNIVGKAFEKKSDTSALWGVKFDSETQFTYYESGNLTPDGNKKEQKINYEIKNGQVIVKGDQDLWSGAYYQRIKGERITFDEAFSRVQLIVAQVSKIGDGSDHEAIEKLDMSFVIDDYPTYINGKTFTANVNSSQVRLTLTDGKGKIEVYHSGTLEEQCEINFEYKFNKAGVNSDATYSLSNITYSKTGYTLGNTITLETYTHRLVFELQPVGECKITVQ